MIRLSTFVFLLFSFVVLNSQTKNFEFNFCSIQKDTKTEEKYNLFLIGEFHRQGGNFRTLLNFNKYLESVELSPNYIIYELSPSWGYLMNRYLITGNDTIFNLIEANLEQKKMYESYREFHLSLPENKKSKFIGVDIERDYLSVYFAIGDIFKQGTMFCDYSYENIDSIIKCNCSTEMKICSIINNIKKYRNSKVFNDYMKEDLDALLVYFKSDYSDVFKQSLDSILYDDLSQILKSYEISKKRKKIFMQNENKEFQFERERFMTNQIYRLFVNNPKAIVYGQFGIDHVLLSTYKKSPKAYEENRLAIVLNNDKAYPLTNDKVCSNVIYYEYLKPNKYKFLDSDLKNIPNEFNNMKDCQLKIIDFENKTKANNLILFKSQ